MIIANSIASYSILTIVTNTGKKSFENLGRFLKKSGDIVSRMLRPGEKSLEISQGIAKQMFRGKKEIVLAIDETEVKKIYSRLIEGVFWLFNTKIGRSIRAYSS